MIEFACECGEPLAAAPEHVGKRVKCPRCGDMLTVPAAEFEDAPPPPPPKKKAVLVDEDDPPPRRKRKPPPAGRDSPGDPVKRLMDRAHAELDADEAKRAKEWRPVVFTPGMIGGTAVFVICSLLAVLALLMFQLYLAVGLICFAVLGLARAVLSYLGTGVD